MTKNVPLWGEQQTLSVGFSAFWKSREVTMIVTQKLGEWVLALSAITCSKLTIETVEQDVKCVQR